MLQSAVEQTALELGKEMPVMTRGPELELSTIKDVEDLKHTLAQHNIHVANDVLRRAIVLPKDLDTANTRYATPFDLLPKNPNKDFLQLKKREEQAVIMKEIRQWQEETFPWHAKKVEEEVPKDKKGAKGKKGPTKK